MKKNSPSAPTSLFARLVALLTGRIARPAPVPVLIPVTIHQQTRAIRRVR